MRGLVKLESLSFSDCIICIGKKKIKTKQKKKKERVGKKQFSIQQKKVVNKFGGIKGKINSAKVMKQLM